MGNKCIEEDVAKRFVRSYYELAAERRIRSRNAFCAIVGISSSSNFSKMENGIRKPTVSHLCNLISEFNISPEWIFFGTGEPIKKEKIT